MLHICFRIYFRRTRINQSKSPIAAKVKGADHRYAVLTLWGANLSYDTCDIFSSNQSCNCASIRFWNTIGNPISLSTFSSFN